MIRSVSPDRIQVLHATTELKRTLENTKKLLQPYVTTAPRICKL